MIKAIIFDLDGVIVSTDELHYEAWKKMADKQGIEFNKEINHRLRGVSRAASLDIILEKSEKTYSDEEKQALMDYKNEYYKTLLSKLTEEDILPGINKVLETLKEKNIQIAIGSSSRNAQIILEHIGLLKTFEAISDGTDVIRSKPDPEVFLVAAKKLQIDPKYCAVVEDAHAGITAAKRAGMVAIAVGDAMSSEEADYKFTNILDLLKIV